MKELLQTINHWQKNHKPFAIATVIQTWGSAPRPVGSSMIVSEDKEMAGSVSGGCVEGAVIREALPLIETGTAKRLAFGVTDDEAWAVGLSCGGQVQVFAERFLAFDERPEERQVWEQLQSRLENNEPCVLLTRLEEGRGRHLLVLPDGTTFGNGDAELRTEALRAYRERKNQAVEAAGAPWFAQVFPRRSRMLIIGAAHITVDLVTLARFYDFEAIVIDPRGIFSSKTQFDTPPDRIFAQYPSEVLPDYDLDAYDYAVVLSHDPKIDDNALHLLLRSDVAYIGALGSRRTHAKRTARLLEAGFSQEEIDRIHAPVGVDINAQTPREIALSIMAEIIKTKNVF